MAVRNAENSRSLADVHDSIKSAVVTIELPDGSGSGFAVRPDGVLATNRHVIAGHTTARISFFDGNDTTARVIQSFRDVDLAFLLAEEPVRQVLPLHNGEQLRVGQEVFAVGNPSSLGHTLTKGTISALNRLKDGVRYIQTDTAINPGNSGGPLCDLNGQVVGMATWIRRWDSQGTTPLEGLNFALPCFNQSRKNLRFFPREANCLKLCTASVCGGINAEGKYCGTCGVELALYTEEAAKSPKRQVFLGKPAPVCQTKARRGPVTL